jgi:hypothetical protein
MKRWISKFALTKGVFEAEGRMSEMGYFRVTGYYSTFCKSEYHATREEAVAKAEKMRERKIISLQNQIEKLRLLKF